MFRGLFRGLWAVYKRELAGYFATPVAYVFIVVFLLLAGVFAFSIGQMLEARQANLRVFFNFHPWLYLFLMPAIAMRLWAEERKVGTIELLMTLPVTKAGAVLGKFLAAWTFAGVALMLTVPVWITINYLGQPDNGAAFAGYLGSWLMAGGFLAIGACVSATTRNQVIAFVVSVVICLGFLLAGYPPVIDAIRGWASPVITDTVASFSFMTRFDAISKGVIDPRDVLFFFSLIAVALVANTILVEAKKS
jgi:ABC-2 type transport system permease protein